MIFDNRVCKVFVKKSANKTARLGTNATTDMVYGINRIGAALRNNDVLRGLTFEEEKILLADIIGISPTSPDWKAATREYWLNITVEVDVQDSDNRGGLVLETGFMYPDEASAKIGRAEESKELTLFNKALDANKEYNMVFDNRLKYGFPINTTDFIQYRFILQHPIVANRVDDLHKSPKIEYYIHSQDVENKIKHESLAYRKKAYQIFHTLTDDKIKTRYMLLLLQRDIENIGRAEKFTFDLSNEMGQELALEKLATTVPGRFIAVYEDENLVEKAFIEECIKHKHLKRIANTDTIKYGENTLLGYNLDDAITYIRDPRNGALRQELEAKITNWEPLAKIVEVESEDEDTNVETLETGSDVAGTKTTLTSPVKEKVVTKK